MDYFPGWTAKKVLKPLSISKSLNNLYPKTWSYPFSAVTYEEPH